MHALLPEFKPRTQFHRDITWPYQRLPGQPSAKLRKRLLAVETGTEPLPTLQTYYDLVLGRNFPYLLPEGNREIMDLYVLGRFSLVPVEEVLLSTEDCILARNAYQRVRGETRPAGGRTYLDENQLEEAEALRERVRQARAEVRTPPPPEEEPEA